MIGMYVLASTLCRVHQTTILQSFFIVVRTTSSELVGVHLAVSDVMNENVNPLVEDCVYLMILQA